MQKAIAGTFLLHWARFLPLYDYSYHYSAYISLFIILWYPFPISYPRLRGSSSSSDSHITCFSSFFLSPSLLAVLVVLSGLVFRLSLVCCWLWRAFSFTWWRAGLNRVVRIDFRVSSGRVRARSYSHSQQQTIKTMRQDLTYTQGRGQAKETWGAIHRIGPISHTCSYMCIVHASTTSTQGVKCGPNLFRCF